MDLKREEFREKAFYKDAKHKKKRTLATYKWWACTHVYIHEVCTHIRMLAHKEFMVKVYIQTVNGSTILADGPTWFIPYICQK